jgi:heptosyltransferase I
MKTRNVDTVIVRMDKIGDLVLSMPVDEHPGFAGSRVHWFISKGLAFVAEQAAPKRIATEFKRNFSPFEFFRMVKWLRKNNPRTIILLHNPWWVSMAAWWTEVPERIGRRSQWHSFFFLNVPIAQKRSVSDRHESDFNFDLVEWGFNRLGVRQAWNLHLLKGLFLRLVPPNPFGTVAARNLRPKAYRVVHPGMAGSALNWPQQNYTLLIERLAQEMPVLVTGTATDGKYLQKIEHIKHHNNVRWLVGDLKTTELLDLLSQARSVIAPSTGVLHLAASLGTPSLGLYSPRKAEHPRRWGPKGLYSSFLVPPVQEAELFSPDVMAKISPDQVYDALVKLEGSDVLSQRDAQPTV